MAHHHSCGCDESKALREAAVSALGFLPRNDPGARMAAEKIERALSSGIEAKPAMVKPSRCDAPSGYAGTTCELPAGHAGEHRCRQAGWF